MRKKFLSRLLIASVLVGGVNFLPINFSAENLRIISVTYANVENVSARFSTKSRKRRDFFLIITK